MLDVSVKFKAISFGTVYTTTNCRGLYISPALKAFLKSKVISSMRQCMKIKTQIRSLQRLLNSSLLCSYLWKFREMNCADYGDFLGGWGKMITSLMPAWPIEGVAGYGRLPSKILFSNQKAKANNIRKIDKYVTFYIFSNVTIKVDEVQLEKKVTVHLTNSYYIIGDPSSFVLISLVE